MLYYSKNFLHVNTTTICWIIIVFLWAFTIKPSSALGSFDENANSRGLQLILAEDSDKLHNRNFQGKFWALIIGINNYTHWPKLETAVNDARELESILLSKYGFSPNHIISLIDHNATAQSLINAFRNLYYQLEEEDSLLIYYAGHGYLDEFDIGSWIPVDAQQGALSEYIGTDRVNQMISKLRARHIFLVADACYSGSLLATRGILSESAFEDKYFKENFRRISRQVLTSGGLEVVTDHGFDNHSIFAYHFLRELSHNNEPFLSASELSARIENLVIRNADQSPTWARLRNSGDENGEFFFLQNSTTASHPLDETIKQVDFSAPQSLPYTQASLQTKPTKHIKIPGSKIDWENGYIEVTEIGTADMSMVKNTVQAEIIALKSAKHLGYSRLIEMLQGVKITNNSQYRKALLHLDITTVDSAGMLRGVELISEAITWEHSAPKATVTLRLSLTTSDTAPPRNIDKRIMPQPTPSNTSEIKQPLPVSLKYTGLVIDARHLSLKQHGLINIVTPTATNVLKVGNKHKSYRSKNDKNFYKVSYHRDLSSSSVGDNPIVIKAHSLLNNDSLVISEHDANTIHNIEQKQEFLNQQGIVVIF